MFSNRKLKYKSILKDSSSNKDHFGELENLFKMYFKDLVLFATIYVTEIATAEDIVQDMFFEFWKENKMNSVKSNPRQYLFTSTKNKCLMFLRKRKFDFVEIDSGFQNIPFYILDDEEKNVEDIVKGVIENLPEKRALIIKLHFFEGLKYTEISESLNISINTVKTQVRKALAQIREEIQDNTYNIPYTSSKP
jgi:RNA polymerase sigma-70 factor (ECF subfamily)